MRFWKVTSRIFKGVKSLGIGALFGWGLVAVPAGGSWAGV